MSGLLFRMSSFPSSLGIQFTISLFQSSNFVPVRYGMLRSWAIISLYSSGSAAMWSILIPDTPGAVFFFFFAKYLSSFLALFLM